MALLDLPQPPMFRLLSDVFGNVLPRERTDLDFDGWPELLERADSGVEIGRALRATVSILQYLKEKSPVTLAPATKILADGSRHGLYRLPFGDETVLDFYLDLLAEHEAEHDWTSDALRLVGNSCADLDINRKRVLAKLKLPALLHRLREKDKADIAIGVLYNICLDYETAQVALRANRLFSSLIQLFESRYYTLDFLPQISHLLDIAVEDFNPEAYPNTQAITVIYQTITIPGADIETQVTLANAIVTLLKQKQIQQTLIEEDDKLLVILDLIEFSYTQDAANMECSPGSTLEPKLHHPAQDPEDEAQLTALRSALSARLWDMTALTEFTVKRLPASEFIQRLVSWLSIDEPQMQVCACSILRNVASSDQNATDMVMTLKLHWVLMSLLDSANLQVLEESIRLLKNLALPPANKKELENFESITLLWSKFESPTLHYAATSLVRQLLRGCFDNVHRFLRPNTPAQNDSYASRLLQLYSNTDDSAIKTEVTRAIVEIWRTANSGNSEEVRSQVFCVEEAVRETGVHPEDMVKPVTAMIVESENRSLVTEGWFGLALMASSEEWGEAIYNAMCGDATKDIFKVAISSQEAHSQEQDNVRILVDRLLKQNAHNPTRLDILRPLVYRRDYDSLVEPS